jgi:hypothetical protein
MSAAHPTPPRRDPAAEQPADGSRGASAAGRPITAQPKAVWEGWLAKLKAHTAAHGDCNVPRRWAEDPRLASWVTNQRVYKRKLDRGEPSEGMTAERAARLTALGVNWHPPNRGNTNEAEWEAQLARLAAYKAVHGACNVPRGWAEDSRLSNWVKMQRKRKRKLDHGEPSVGMTAERAARLTALGFTWEGTKAHPNDAQWEAQLARLAAHKAAHGDCSVPYRWAEDPRLSRWVHNQRERKRKLDRGEPSAGMTAERAARLTALGLVWDPIRVATLKRTSGRRSSRAWRPTKRSTATATCRGAGPRTRV